MDVRVECGWMWLWRSSGQGAEWKDCVGIGCKVKLCMDGVIGHA